MSTKKITGKDISREQLLAAIGDGATLTEIVGRLALGTYAETSRAVDGALQREKRNGSIRFCEQRRWLVVTL